MFIAAFFLIVRKCRQLEWPPSARDCPPPQLRADGSCSWGAADSALVGDQRAVALRRQCQPPVGGSVGTAQAQRQKGWGAPGLCVTLSPCRVVLRNEVPADGLILFHLIFK